MSYTPPSATDIQFNFQEIYTQPQGDNIQFDFNPTFPTFDSLIFRFLTPDYIPPVKDDLLFWFLPSIETQILPNTFTISNTFNFAYQISGFTSVFQSNHFINFKYDSIFNFNYSRSFLLKMYFTICCRGNISPHSIKWYCCT